ncbi:MAG: hypothetical protein DCC75_05710 [Proteobacteria bacterium]|nr:MAG: hypothetical protein DCC75_05710 [Pseudomonadota bacterium]
MGDSMRFKLYLLLLCLPFAVNPRSTANAEGPRATLKLGIILPLSGSISFIGDDMRRGIELAAKHAKHVNFELVFEDDKTANRVAAVSAANARSTIGDRLLAKCFRLWHPSPVTCVMRRGP